MAAVDYQAKYEAFLHEVLKDIESKLQSAQRNAEENARASELYCSELKQQLHDSRKVVEGLRERLIATEEELGRAREELKQVQSKRGRAQETAEAPQDIGEFLSAMTCLTVKMKDATTYHCRMDDGLLTGHSFTLTLNKVSWEYTYEPVQPSPSLAPDSNFSSRLCFPDYMLPRFLTNLLNATYNKESN